MTCASMLKQIRREKSIHRSRWRRPRGRAPASSIGGSRNGRNGEVAYAVQTAGNNGSELLIFVPPKSADSVAFLSTSSRCLGPS